MEIAYLAGIVDGEGCLQICKHGPRLRRACDYAFRLRVSNTNLELLKALQAEYGGSIYSPPSHNSSGFGSKRQTSSIDWRGTTAFALVHRILPHLIVKREQAIEILKFEELKAFKHDRWHPVPRHRLEQMDAIYCTVARMRQKGPASQGDHNGLTVR